MDRRWSKYLQRSCCFGFFSPTIVHSNNWLFGWGLCQLMFISRIRTFFLLRTSWKHNSVMINIMRWLPFFGCWVKKNGLTTITQDYTNCCLTVVEQNSSHSYMIIHSRRENLCSDVWLKPKWLLFPLRHQLHCKKHSICWSSALLDNHYKTQHKHNVMLTIWHHHWNLKFEMKTLSSFKKKNPLTFCKYFTVQILCWYCNLQQTIASTDAHLLVQSSKQNLPSVL